MPGFLDKVNQGIAEAKGAVEKLLPDQIAFNNFEYLQYPADLFDPTKHTQMMVLAPYTGEITNKGEELTEYIKSELPPIFLKYPSSFETSYQHVYNEESILFNAKEIAEGGARSGGLKPNDAIQIGTQGLIRETVRALQNLPGGDSARSYFHGGARAGSENLYDGPKLRDFTITWEFYPDDKDDANMFINIYKYLMALSAPTYGLASQRYPSTFDLQFSTLNLEKGALDGSNGLNTVMTFTKVNLIDVTPVFSPSGGPLSPVGLPQEIHLTLQFKEIMHLDRATIMEETKDIGNISVNSAVPSAIDATTQQPKTGLADILGI